MTGVLFGVSLLVCCLHFSFGGVLVHDCPAFVPEGESLNCSCYAPWKKTANITWTQSGKLVPGDERLMIGPVQREWNGRIYTCRTNKNDRIKYTLRVAYGPEDAYIAVKDFSNETVLLACVAEQAYPAVAKIDWYKSGKKMSQKGVTFNYTNDYEQLRKLECRATNLEKKKKPIVAKGRIAHEVLLKLHIKPKTDITILSTTTTTTTTVSLPTSTEEEPGPPFHTCPDFVPEGGTLDCHCFTATNAGKRSSASWESKEGVTGNHLMIASVGSHQNHERYTCRNAGSGDAASYTLRVAFGPDEAWIAVENRSDETVSLVCIATNVYPSASFSWLERDTQEVLSTGARYTFNNKNLGDASQIACRATNEENNAVSAEGRLSEARLQEHSATPKTDSKDSARDVIRVDWKLAFSFVVVAALLMLLVFVLAGALICKKTQSYRTAGGATSRGKSKDPVQQLAEILVQSQPTGSVVASGDDQVVDRTAERGFPDGTGSTEGMNALTKPPEADPSPPDKSQDAPRGNVAHRHKADKPSSSLQDPDAGASCERLDAMTRCNFPSVVNLEDHADDGATGDQKAADQTFLEDSEDASNYEKLCPRTQSNQSLYDSLKCINEGDTADDKGATVGADEEEPDDRITEQEHQQAGLQLAEVLVRSLASDAGASCERLDAMTRCNLPSVDNLEDQADDVATGDQKAVDQTYLEDSEHLYSNTICELGEAEIYANLAAE